MGAIISKRLASVDSIHPDDIIIAVVGQTGVGKSTFINTAAENAILSIGHALKADVCDVQHVECSHPEVHGKVIFVDTPAFDSEPDERNVEKKLRKWLKSVSSKKLKISGILYLHRITDIKLSDPPLRHLTLLKNLCDDSIKGFPNRVVLVTTMWGNLQSPPVGQQRETELQKYWSGLPLGSVVSKVMRFEDSFNSAWAVVFALVPELQSRSKSQSRTLPIGSQ